MHCLHHCGNSWKCWQVVNALQKYKDENGEPCPFEAKFFAEHQIPACIIARADRLIPGRTQSS